MFPRSTHETFAQKLYQTFKNHKRFAKPKLARSDFTICHYAGDVSAVLSIYMCMMCDTCMIICVCILKFLLATEILEV